MFVPGAISQEILFIESLKNVSRYPKSFNKIAVFDLRYPPVIERYKVNSDHIIVISGSLLHLYQCDVSLLAAVSFLQLGDEKSTLFAPW